MMLAIRLSVPLFNILVFVICKFNHHDFSVDVYFQTVKLFRNRLGRWDMSQRYNSCDILHVGTKNGTTVDALNFSLSHGIEHEFSTFLDKL